MAAMRRWVRRWWLAAVELLLVVAGVGALWNHTWKLLIICLVLQVGVAGTRRSLSRRTPQTSRMPNDRAGAVAQGGQTWVGSASLPSRLRVGSLNMRVNVGKNAAEMTLVGRQLSLHVRGYNLDSVMGTLLVDLTPIDGAAVFPARPFLAGRGLGIQPVGAEAYYFFPRQRNREQILLALQAEGFQVEARERRPSKI